MTELREKHPELSQMCKTEWRKHYRSLTTDEEKRQARSQRAKQVAKKNYIISQHQNKQRADKKEAKLTNIKEKYTDDKFRLLHLTVAELFAKQLQQDLKAAEEDRPTDVSLAAKWAPSPS
ncbi:hypothetical protein MMC14_010659, partial [Varicellaria rhodocarpa]|nr:hypothetical protein [Varicellaria rhodocarpa]